MLRKTASRRVGMETGLGIEFHTFSLVGRCARTGMLGVGITTSEIAVGSRCPFVRSKVAAVATQAMTNPRLGTTALEMLGRGAPAEDVVSRLAAEDGHIERRQIGVVDALGRSAARTGSLVHPWAGHLTGHGYVAMGNGLVGEGVVRAMAEAFEASEEENLEERLMRAVQAGQDAGGEAAPFTPYHSAALVVYGDDSFSRVDLRVDDHPEPLTELRRLLELLKPRIDYYAVRARDPESAIAPGPPQGLK
jgi:uncharacterized Ntn-hydrolase superfamily protein